MEHYQFLVGFLFTLLRYWSSGGEEGTYQLVLFPTAEGAEVGDHSAGRNLVTFHKLVSRFWMLRCFFHRAFIDKLGLEGQAYGLVIGHVMVGEVAGNESWQFIFAIRVLLASLVVNTSAFFIRGVLFNVAITSSVVATACWLNNIFLVVDVLRICLRFL